MLARLPREDAWWTAAQRLADGFGEAPPRLCSALRRGPIRFLTLGLDKRRTTSPRLFCDCQRPFWPAYHSSCNPARYGAASDESFRTSMASCCRVLWGPTMSKWEAKASGTAPGCRGIGCDPLARRNSCGMANTVTTMSCGSTSSAVRINTLRHFEQQRTTPALPSASHNNTRISLLRTSEVSTRFRAPVDMR